MATPIPPAKPDWSILKHFIEYFAAVRCGPCGEPGLAECSMRIASMLDERTCALMIIALSIIIGVAYPPLAVMLEPCALPALFFVVLFSLVPFATLGLRELVSVNRNVIRVLGWQLLVLPALVMALGILCRFPPQIISLLIVTTCSGALFASPALAALLELDQRQSLQCMVLSTLVMPVSLYLFLCLDSYQDGWINMDIQVYVTRILIFLGLPSAIFLGYRQIDRRMSEPVRRHAAGVCRWAVVFSLAVFGIGMMRSVADRLVSNPAQVYFFLAITTILCVGMLTVTAIVMYRFGLNDALTAAILSGFRNVGLGYALIGEMIGPDLSVYVGIGLLPVFTAPFILKIFANRPQ